MTVWQNELHDEQKAKRWFFYLHSQASPWRTWMCCLDEEMLVFFKHTDRRLRPGENMYVGTSRLDPLLNERISPLSDVWPAFDPSTKNVGRPYVPLVQISLPLHSLSSFNLTVKDRNLKTASLISYWEHMKSRNERRYIETQLNENDESRKWQLILDIDRLLHIAFTADLSIITTA